jgi:hypothetical protein
VKAGWTTKFTSLGNSHIYGEYGENHDAFIRGMKVDGDFLAASKATRYGVGVVQEIDAAAMSLWAKWRHHELDLTNDAGVHGSPNDVDMFLAGAVIFY